MNICNIKCKKQLCAIEQISFRSAKSRGKYVCKPSPGLGFWALCYIMLVGWVVVSLMHSNVHSQLYA